MLKSDLPLNEAFKISVGGYSLKNIGLDISKSGTPLENNYFSTFQIWYSIRLKKMIFTGGESHFF